MSKVEYRFDRLEIEVAVVGGILKVPADCYREFGVHNHVGVGEDVNLFRVTHLPAGRCIAHSFTELKFAAAAAVDIAALRNDWSTVDANDRRLRQRIVEIAKQYGGLVGGETRGRVSSLNRLYLAPTGLQN